MDRPAGARGVRLPLAPRGDPAGVGERPRRRLGAGAPRGVARGRRRVAEPERPGRQGRRHGRGTHGSRHLTNPPVPELALPPQQVEELLQILSKGIRATQLYLPNNPVYQRAVDNIRASFRQIWQATDDLVFDVAETELRWEDNVVYNQEQRGESIAWTLYKDGVRSLAFKPGVEETEIVRFLGVLQRARNLRSEEHTSELQSLAYLVCRLLLEKKKK